MNDDDDGPSRADHRGPGKGRRGRLIALGLVLLLLVAGVMAWVQRRPIAGNILERELAARGVPASYRLASVGPRTQRIENLILGDPADPDLVVRELEIDLGYDRLVPRIMAIRAKGARLHGRWVDGKLSLGVLDRFRSAQAGPLGLPDMTMSLDDAKARIETPAGPLGVFLEGSGNLAGGFSGKLAAVMRDARAGGCVASAITAYLDVRVRDRAPTLSGPVRAPALACAQAGVGAADLNADVTLGAAPELDRFSGSVRARAGAARIGDILLAKPLLTVHGEAGGEGASPGLRGRYGLELAGLGAGSARLGETRAEGVWALGPPGGAGGWSSRGRVRAHDVALLDPRTLARLRASAAGTPVAPLAARLADAIGETARSGRLDIGYALEQAGGAGRLVLDRLELANGKGGRVALGEASRMTLAWPQRDWRLEGSITSRGGGLPEAALRLSPVAGGGLAGQLFMEPYAAPGARLALEPLHFQINAKGDARISTELTLDGPLPDGRLRGLHMPIRLTAGNGTVRLDQGCTQVRADAIELGALRIGKLGLRLCPARGRSLAMLGSAGLSGVIETSELKIAGRLGDSAMRLRAARASYDLAHGAFGLDAPELVLGDGPDPVRLSAVQLTGGTGKSGLAGSASGLKSRIAAVPILVNDGAVNWRFAGGALRVEGPLTLIDDARPDRFNPLTVRDFAFIMANGRITAGGALTLPRGSAEIARVAIVHELASGEGHADIAVDALHFGPALQPEEISRLALGVIANVRGQVRGSGEVRWSSRGVTASTGEFRTDGTDLAAAFGPVAGLSGTLRFTDLIGLVSAPGQVASVVSINPGIEVRDGHITYRLLAGQRVAVEGAHWPFAGGDLTLLPTIFDFSADHPRSLSFRVVGLDAGAFVNTLELENISATGTFDGLLPMLFDSSGGRIVGGLLVARQQGRPPLVIDSVAGLDVPCDRARPGGTLSYVGQVSNENLGKLGRLAFDALKDLSFKCLTIWMDGAIDGEVVTQIAFNGINRGRLSSVPEVVSRQFVGLPFIFNVKIAAPFRGLLNTARSFVDPGLLIRSHLGDQLAPAHANSPAVQPGESDSSPQGGVK